MGNFEDFDLDLKKVAKKGEGRGITDLFTLLTQYSIEHCGDPSNATTPTTGMTTGCCNKNVDDSEPRCV